MLFALALNRYMAASACRSRLRLVAVFRKRAIPMLPEMETLSFDQERPERPRIFSAAERHPGRADVLQDEGEFVASETGDQVALPQGVLEALRHLLEQQVTLGVAKQIVDGLEPIQIRNRTARRVRLRWASCRSGSGGRRTRCGWAAG
jgi:hypothetical protein